MTLLASIRGTLSGVALEHYSIILLATLILFTSCQIIYELFLSPLSRFPGPFWARLTDLWHVRLVRSGYEHTTVYALHEKYGSVVRIGPSKLCVLGRNSPGAAH